MATLNCVLKELKRWQDTPAIFLVGNHDQIDLGGREHSIFPLAAACPSIKVLDVPTTFAGALWLPYRRDPAELQRAIAEAGNVHAVFAHADVVRRLLSSPLLSSSAA